MSENPIKELLENAEHHARFSQLVRMAEFAMTAIVSGGHISLAQPEQVAAKAFGIAQAMLEEAEARHSAFCSQKREGERD